jgi:pimeloyl-ACP methyl ester carboxylesterase
MTKIATCLSIFLLSMSFLGAGDGHGRKDHQVKLCDGRVLNYQEYGNCNGRLVLWFHGLNSSSRAPELVDREICQSGLRVICIDRPGIGKSSSDPDRAILGWPSDVQEFTRAIGHGNKPFGIISTSGGSSYGCAYALKYPHRVTHLALVTPYAPFDAPCIESGNAKSSIQLAANAPNLAKAVTKNMIKKLDENPDQIMKRFKRKYNTADVKLVYDNPVNYNARIENLRHMTVQGPCGVVTDAGLHAGDWGYEICQIKNVPVTIWSGGDDPVAPPSMAKYFHCQIRGSRLFTSPKDGHATLLKNKAAAILSQF